MSYVRRAAHFARSYEGLAATLRKFGKVSSALSSDIWRRAGDPFVAALICRRCASCPPEKFHVLAYGAPDPSRLSSATAKIASEAPEATAFVPDILFMSNLYIDKGPLDLLEVSRRLHTQGIAHRVIFVGGKADAAVDEALARAIAEDGSGRIDLRGAIYGAQKDALLHSVQIFAFPSYYHFECQPLSVIEAMSHGLAIVASDIAGIPDLIRDGEDGFLIPARDPDALVSGLRKLLLDRGLRERLGRSARERYETLFTLQAFEQRLVETIEKIVL